MELSEIDICRRLTEELLASRNSSAYIAAAALCSASVLGLISVIFVHHCAVFHFVAGRWSRRYVRVVEYHRSLCRLQQVPVSQQAFGLHNQDRETTRRCVGEFS